MGVMTFLVKYVSLTHNLQPLIFNYGMFNINFCHLGISSLSYNDVLHNNIMFYSYKKQLSTLYMKTTAAFQCVGYDFII
jgi:hypothetical protein